MNPTPASPDRLRPGPILAQTPGGAFHGCLDGAGRACGIFWIEAERGSRATAHGALQALGRKTLDVFRGDRARVQTGRKDGHLFLAVAFPGESSDAQLAEQLTRLRAGVPDLAEAPEGAPPVAVHATNYPEELAQTRDFGAGAGRGPAPTRLGAYELLSEIGRGGMAVVYRARHSALGKIVALKVFQETPATLRDAVERFRREAQLLASISHPHIVPVHDVGSAGTHHFFAMDLLEGGTMEAWLKEKPPREQVLEVMEAVCRAVHHAHTQGIIHRDLKPANVFLEAGRRPVVTDFGLGKLLAASESAGDITVSGTVFGTPQYMAPEQAAGRTRQLGPATDIYALGATLYRAVTGVPPFEAENATLVLVRVLREVPLPPRRIDPRLPAALESVILRAMARKPGDRYPSAEALADDLLRMRTGEAIRPVPWLRRSPGRARRLTIGAAVASVALATVAVFALRPERTAPPVATTGPAVEPDLQAAHISAPALDEAALLGVDGTSVEERRDRVLGAVLRDGAEGRLDSLERLQRVLTDLESYSGEELSDWEARVEGARGQARGSRVQPGLDRIAERIRAELARRRSLSGGLVRKEAEAFRAAGDFRRALDRLEAYREAHPAEAGETAMTAALASVSRDAEAAAQRLESAQVALAKAGELGPRREAFERELRLLPKSLAQRTRGQVEQAREMHERALAVEGERSAQLAREKEEKDRHRAAEDEARRKREVEEALARVAREEEERRKAEDERTQIAREGEERKAREEGERKQTEEAKRAAAAAVAAVAPGDEDRRWAAVAAEAENLQLAGKAGPAAKLVQAAIESGTWPRLADVLGGYRVALENLARVDDAVVRALRTPSDRPVDLLFRDPSVPGGVALVAGRVVAVEAAEDRGPEVIVQGKTANTTRRALAQLHPRTAFALAGRAAGDSPGLDSATQRVYRFLRAADFRAVRELLADGSVDSQVRTWAQRRQRERVDALFSRLQGEVGRREVVAIRKTLAEVARAAQPPFPSAQSKLLDAARRLLSAVLVTRGREEEDFLRGEAGEAGDLSASEGGDGGSSDDGGPPAEDGGDRTNEDLGGFEEGAAEGPGAGPGDGGGPFDGGDAPFDAGDTPFDAGDSDPPPAEPIE